MEKSVLFVKPRIGNQLSVLSYLESNKIDFELGKDDLTILIPFQSLIFRKPEEIAEILYYLFDTGTITRYDLDKDGFTYDSLSLNSKDVLYFLGIENYIKTTKNGEVFIKGNKINSIEDVEAVLVRSELKMLQFAYKAGVFSKNPELEKDIEYKFNNDCWYDERIQRAFNNTKSNIRITRVS